jgi:hypothetical protein
MFSCCSFSDLSSRLAFVLIETKVAQRPLMPFGVFRGETGFVLGAAGFGWASFGIWLYYIWQYFLQIRHYSPLEATARFFPILPMGLLATGLTDWLSHAFNPPGVDIDHFHGRIHPWLSPSGRCVGHTDLLDFDLCFARYHSFQSGHEFPRCHSHHTSNTLPKDQQGMAGRLVSTVVNYSISLGLGFAATVEVYTDKGRRIPEDILNGSKGA